MISMDNWATQAVNKLSQEKKAVAGNKEKAMAEAVYRAIEDFCLQDEEFAQAVVQGGSFVDCMKKVASGVGNSISDLDAYKKAVQFYFPGAEVKMQLTIDLIGKAAGETKNQAQPDPVAAQPAMILDLADFFG
ncbi:MAG: hypothetical protein J6A26_04800 [Oscillospiraceae bacterium]|nr:hypothetical protein [Oscillospiraceae bacterium]